MIDREAFTPRWASPPGDTIRDALATQGMTVEAFAVHLGLPIGRTRALIDGTEPISIELARRLGEVIGGSVSFWVSRDGQYRDTLDLLATDAWSSGLPIKDMANLGWIQRPTDWKERVGTALEFFAVPDLATFDRKYGAVVKSAHFRFSAARLDAGAVAAWLRRAEIEADGVELMPYDAARFRQSLAGMRELSMIRDPAVFIPELQKRSAEVGVSTQVVRPPQGCAASGAARFLGPTRPQIILSARYKTDDHFWFMYFHEAAHLLLHSEQTLFVDEFERDTGPATSGVEGQADEFAGELLLPATLRSVLRRPPVAPREVVRLARAAGTSPGVVVGQLQHFGVLGFNTSLNGFKRRYRWSGTSLERA